jgi:hypothetical protein
MPPGQSDLLLIDERGEANIHTAGITRNWPVSNKS